jgi:xanthine dehydrogenase accessory factor
LSDPLEKALEWSASGQKIALAAVVETWGSSPRPVGSMLAVNESDEFEGSVSGGCVEGAVITEALEIMDGGAPRLLTFSVDNAQAWQAGLTCGGTLKVLVARGGGSDILAQLAKARQERRPAVLITNAQSGHQHILYDDAEGDASDLSPELRTLALETLKTGQSRLVEAEGETVFLRSFLPQPRLHIIGATHITQTLAPMARMVGYDVAIIDPRSAFAAKDRFPGFDPLVEWPDEYFARITPDRMTAIVSLTHDEKIDDPTLAAAIRSDCFYIGALGSKRTHAKRVDRLHALGLADDDIARIHAPIGMKLGGRAPAEIAVAIMAEMTRARYQQAGPE